MADLVTIDLDLCDGCDLCTRACPVDVLRLDQQTKKAYVAYPDHCHVCYLCEDDCPTHAIKVTVEFNNPHRRSIYDVLDLDTDGNRL
jgi:NAD-dependent dihydropyrimidine dehydrogenase PreA subunit